MSLVYTCVTAHTPLLMPTIGKEKMTMLQNTKDAMEQIEKEMYLAQPETILVITPHGETLPDALSINLNPKYVSDFKDFGDLTTKLEWKTDMLVIERIREDFKHKQLPLTLTSASSVDYGTSVPLYYLTPHLPSVRVIPLTASRLDTRTHFEIGKQLKDEIIDSTKRIAVVASVDLSHRSGENSTEGYLQKGAAFDERIVEIIHRHRHLDIMDVDDATVDEVKACGVKVFAVLMGLIDEISHRSEILSYEKPFGTGYIVAQMKLN